MTRPGKWENVKTDAGWHLRLVAANGEIVLTSEKYTRKAAADAALTLVQRSSGEPELDAPQPKEAAPPNLFTQDQVRALAVQAGFTPYNAKIAAAIAMCEAPYVQGGVAYSNFGAVGDLDLMNEIWGPSVGGMQIRSLKADRGTGRTRDELRLIDPVFNMKAARQVKLAAGSFRPWSTFTSGMWKAYAQDQYPPPPNTYVVVAGDTLSGIAKKLGNQWGWQDLARANGLHSPYTIRIGDLLLLPGSDAPGA